LRIITDNNQYVGSGSVSPGTSWTRGSVTYTVPSTSPGWIGAAFYMDPNFNFAHTVWVDAVQLEEGGSPTSYTPDGPNIGPDYALYTGQPGNILLTGQPASLSAFAYNPDATAAFLAGRLDVFDTGNARVASQPVNLSLPAQSTAQSAVPL